MTPDADLLRAMLSSFDAATQSLDSCRILLSRLLDEIAPMTDVEIDDDLTLGRCPHPDAIEVTSFGDMDPLYICPDCGEQFS